MCGFAGELSWDGADCNLSALERMTSSLRPRGPDSGGVMQRGALGLGHRRLTIIDLSAAGEQPMVDAELGLSLVFNGCIYNYRELRAELQGAGYRFFSSSDTEVILKAYHRWGPRCVDHFLGMFAFVIAERDSGRLVMARDRLGIKPLYVSRLAGRLRFASTLQALVAAGDVDTSIDLQALHHYLSFHSVVPAPLTILRGVRKLPAATIRIVHPDGTETDEVYWRPQFSRDDSERGLSAAGWQERVLGKLTQAVERRRIADVPTGVLLSGGLDSSLIVGLLARAGQSQLKTFSIGFEPAGGMSGDEFEYSDLIAKTFGTDHQRIRIQDAQLLPAVVPAVRAMSEPMVSHDAVAFYLLSREVVKSVKVVQSGQGADEVFAGYEWYPPLAGVRPEQALDAYSRAFFDWTHSELAGMVTPEFLAQTDVSRDFVRQHFDAPGADTALDRALRIDSLVMLVDDPVKRVDNMTMAWGLEGRVPFLDHELVELAARCPPELKLAQGGKGVLKEAARALLPAAVIDRPKGYFPVPGIRHLEGDLLSLVRDALLSQPARDRGIFRPDFITTLLDEPNRLRSNLGVNALWQAGLLELWLQELLRP
ncbi:MAG: N-acetylglutaminylglutamine amidotransferase [Myxococcales bacterium]|nr:MAG: N-acetylglutaminylglutamine amidotransferase [Myxococcales bacterium]